MSKPKSSNVTIVENAPRVVNVDYQLLVAERDDLLEAEIGYQRRIEKLQKEGAETLRSFDILYNENKILRSKLDTPDGTAVDSVESYNEVYKDRDHLREANRAFKRRIRQLEDDINTEQKKYTDLHSKYQLVTQKAQLETEFATRAKDEKIDDLEKEQDEMEKKFKLFLKEREQYEYRIAEMDKERNELQNKYDRVSDEKHEFQLRCDVLQEDRGKLKQKVADLEVQVPDAEKKAKEEQQYLELQAQVVALQIANTDATKEVHKLNEEIRILQKLKREKAEVTDRASSVIVDEEQQAEEKAKANRLEDTLQELDEFKKRSYYVLRENDKLKDEADVLNRKLENYESVTTDLRKELNFKTTEIEEMSAKMRGDEAINEEYLSLQEKNKDLSALNSALQNELLQEKKLAKLKEMELSKNLEKVEDKYNEIEKEKMKLDYEIKTLKDEDSNQKKVIEAQASELRNMKAQIEQLQTMLDEKSKTVNVMKQSEKEAKEELRESLLNLHVTRHELASIKVERAGHFHALRKEMEDAKTERKEESEQMRQETIKLKEEVKKLKDYEFKITTMDSEIRRLMNRLRMAERYKKTLKKSDKINEDSEELKALKKKQKDLEKENNQLLVEKRQLEILKKKYGDLLTSNRRLADENKRVRGDLDDSHFKVDNLEKRVQKLNTKGDPTVTANGTSRAVYVEKENQTPAKPSIHLKRPPPETALTRSAAIVISSKRGIRSVVGKGRRKFERKTTRMATSIDKSGMRSTKPILPAVPKTGGLQFGKGYRHLYSGKIGVTDHLSLL